VTPQTALQAEGARGATSHAARGRLRGTLVAVQVASAVVLATGAGLLVQSLINRQHVDLGFNPSGAVRADLSLSGPRFASAETLRATAAAVLDRIGRDPAVSAAGAQAWALPGGVGARPQFSLPNRGNVLMGAGAPNAIEGVTPEYFAAMGVPIREGRVFGEVDRPGAPLVAVINEELARHLSPGRSPIGEVVRLGAPGAAAAPQVTIVGVVGSIRRSAMHGFVVSRIYVPYAQFPGSNLSLVVRARADAGAAMTAMQTAIRQTDAALVLDAARTVEADVAAFVQPVRFITVLFTAFGVTGLLLAALGVFGTMSYAVSQRRREMAVRAALGAARRDIVRLVLGSGLRITAFGLAGGLVAAILAARALGSFLFEVEPADPLTLAAVALTLVAVSLAACYRPARLAASTDPMTVLRRD
jgi:predicted permease